MGRGETVLDPAARGRTVSGCQKYKGRAKTGASRGKSQLLRQILGFPRARSSVATGREPLARLPRCEGGA